MGRIRGRYGANLNKAKKTAPQQSPKEKGEQNNNQTCAPPRPPRSKQGEKYVSSAGRPLQATKSSQQQRAYQKTVHVNFNQRSVGRSPSRPTPAKHPSVQPREVNNVSCTRTETDNSNSPRTQPRDSSNDSPKGRKKRKRHSRKLQSKDQEDQEQTQKESQSNILVSNHIESSQTTTPIVYYAIRNGAYGYYGVHTDWDVCVRYLKGSPGATFKSFTHEEEAFEFAHGDYHQVTPPPPEKKLKREGPLQTAKVNSQGFTEPQAEKRSREKVERSREVDLSTRRRRQHQQATRIEPRPKVGSPSSNGLLSRDLKPLPLKVEGDSIQIEDDSVDEAEEPQICETNRKTQQVSSSEPSSEVQFVEELNIQTVKVEPTLLPKTQFSSEANRVPVKTAKDVKIEELLAQTGPRKNSLKHLR